MASQTNIAYTAIRNDFCPKISFATFGVSIDDFFTRYAGLGYSLSIFNLPSSMITISVAL